MKVFRFILPSFQAQKSENNEYNWEDEADSVDTVRYFIFRPLLSLFKVNLPIDSISNLCDPFKVNSSVADPVFSRWTPRGRSAHLLFGPIIPKKMYENKENQVERGAHNPPINKQRQCPVNIIQIRYPFFLI